MNLWDKLTGEWLCMLGDWLWANVVVASAAFLDQLTFRRVIFTAGLLVLTIGFAQAFAADLAFIFAADAMTYFEIATAVMLVAAIGRARVMLRFAGQHARRMALKVSSILTLHRQRMRQ